MKKALIVATVDSHISCFHLAYIKMLHDMGYVVHVATNGTEDFPFCDKHIKISVERSPYKLNNIKAIKELKQLISKEKYDLIHCHTPMGSVVTRLAAKNARKNGTRVIYTAHGFHFYKGAPLLNWLLFYPIEKYLAKYTDTLITINSEDFELAKNKFSKRCHSIEYIPGVGIDPKKFDIKMTEKEKKELRKSLGLKDYDFVMIYPARLDKNKNQVFLIDVMEELVKDHNNIHLLLPGADELNGYYQKIVDNKHLNKNIHFLGFRNDIPKLLKISNCTVSSSLREGLPVHILESMCAGLPVIALKCRGMEDLIQDGQNGYIVKAKKQFIEKTNLVMNSNVDKSTQLLFSNFLITNVNILLEKIIKTTVRKKVLHLLSTSTYSGAENVVCNIIKCLSSEYEFFYCSPEGEIRESLKEYHVKYIPLKKMNIFEIKKAIKSVKPDIIHAHDYKASFLSTLINYDGKIISHLHNNVPFAKRWSIKSIMYFVCCDRFDNIIGVSNKIEEEAVFSKKIKEKFNVIYNFVNQQLIVKKSNMFKIQKKYDLFFIGRLTEQKDPLHFIEIVNNLNKMKSINAVMIGSGELERECKDLINELKLNNVIEMVGFQPNPFPIIKSSNVCIMPSKWEGFGLTAIESMCLGKTVLNTGVGGLGEIFIEHEEYLDLSIKNIIRCLNNKDKKSIQKIIKPFICEEAWKKKIINIYEMKRK